MTLVFLILAALCLLYFLILVFAAAVSSLFVWFWPAMAAVFCGLAWFRTHVQSPLWLKAVFWIMVAAILLLFVMVESLIVRHCSDEGEPGLDYLIVLGAQVRGTEPSLSLQLRLDKAAEYLAENPGTKVIVSGGQGSGEDITEAQAMADYLSAKGIASERVIREEKSVTTEENLSFSLALMEDGASRVGIVTNDFHIFRSLQMAKKIGMNACGIAAPSVFYLQPNYLVREFFAVIKYMLSGTIIL